MPQELTIELRELQTQIEEHARSYELDFFDVIFEVLDWEEINEVAAYDGYPARYPHWRFGGGMGPPLNDEEWRYGGDDANVLETIQKGRQGGMPTFECRAPATAGQALKEDGIWKMIAYVRSYYKGDPSKVLW